MPFDQDIADRLIPLLDHKPGMSVMRMMGGFGYLCYGNMCCGVHKNFLMLRLGPERFETLTGKYDDLRVMDFTGRAMKGWGMLDAYSCDDEMLADLVDNAEAFARSLPKKPGK